MRTKYKAGGTQNPYMGITMDPVKPKSSKGSKGKRKPVMMSKKGPISKVNKKPSRNRVMFKDGGMPKAKPC
tara:strand:- start:1080 stop:1292 length:213 start_codon:yes stop_codon:yes gene_type:complete